MLRGGSYHSHPNGAGRRLFRGILFGASLLALGLATSPAQAQFVCEKNPDAGADGATASAGAVACGTSANATGSGTTALGAFAGFGTSNPASFQNTFVGAS